MVSIMCRPSVQWPSSVCGEAHAARCHSTRSRSRLAPTCPPVRTNARKNTRGLATGGAASGVPSPAGCSPSVLGVGSIVVAAMAEVYCMLGAEGKYRVRNVSILADPAALLDLELVVIGGGIALRALGPARSSTR